MRFRFLTVVVATLLGCVNCGYSKHYADVECANAMAGQIAESTVIDDFISPAEGRRVLNDAEKELLFSKISLPSCDSNPKSLEKKYQVALVATDHGHRIDVWLIGEEPSISD